jgi:outer membrane protein assembly factor BamB
MALNLQTGSTEWQFDVSLSARAAYCLSSFGRDLYFGDESGLWVVDLDQGKERQILNADMVTGPPVIVGETLYVGSWDGSLYAVQ